MKRFIVSLSPEAIADIKELHAHILDRSASPRVAEKYLDRLYQFLSGLDLFPERGTIRNEVRPGMRIVGFERSLSIAFVVQSDGVLILRVLAGGRQMQ